ncbi:hypothetical protein [Streptomyces sp. NPDC090025]|uniref:hypothetical protein n=1 Tax=Streptomyces sp. NPDC090025 TaxID=3365922 RepID=UPI0038323627
MSSSTENRPRKRGPLVVASVAAGVLVVGGGVYYAATAFGDGDGTGDAKSMSAAPEPPPLRLDGTSGTGGGAGDGGPGIAPGEPDPGGGPDGGPNGTVYRTKGPLPQGPSSAAVHRPEGRVTSAEVTRLAEALGIPGAPALVGDVWRLTPEKDSAGLRLDVSAKAPGSWTLSRYDGLPIGDSCLKGKACPPPGEAKPPTGGGSPLSEAAAKAAAAPILKAIGQDDAKLDASGISNGSVRVVNADPVVDGLPTYGWSTSLHIGSDGAVTAGGGRLKDPVKGAVYPVVDAKKALADLNEASKGTGRIGDGSCGTPAPGGTAPQCATIARPAPPREVTVTGARFGLAARYVAGEQVLVPSWLFDAKGEPGTRPFTVARTAVDARYLAPPAEATPSPAPTPSADQGAAPRAVTAYGVDPGGRKLSVTFWGGVCSNFTVKADETAGAVTVRVEETPKEPGRVCVMLAQEVTVTTTLRSPLGDRAVVDGASGQRIPQK